MLYILRNIALISQEIIKDIPKILISSFGIIFLIASVIISISLKNTVSDYLRTRIFGELKINQIKIAPKGSTKILSLSSSGMTIDNKKVKKIKNIRGIEKIHEVIRLNCPVTLRAGMFGMYLKTDMRYQYQPPGYNWECFVFQAHLSPFPHRCGPAGLGGGQNEHMKHPPLFLLVVVRPV